MAALIEPEDFKGLMAEAEKAYADGRQTYSYRFRMTRDGITRHMATFAHIVRDEHGAAVRLVGATSDITNEVQTTALLQRQAEQERQLIDRLHMATQAAGISSWEIDLAAGASSGSKIRCGASTTTSKALRPFAPQQIAPGRPGQFHDAHARDAEEKAGSLRLSLPRHQQGGAPARAKPCTSDSWTRTASPCGRSASPGTSPAKSKRRRSSSCRQRNSGSSPSG